MGQPSSKDEMTIRHQFDRLCQMALKGEAVNYYKHMDYRRKHEVTFSELSEKELSKLFTMDEYGTEYHHFEVHGYDIEVKNTLIAEALKELTERKRNVILLSSLIVLRRKILYLKFKSRNLMLWKSFTRCLLNMSGLGRSTGREMRFQRKYWRNLPSYNWIEK